MSVGHGGMAARRRGFIQTALMVSLSFLWPATYPSAGTLPERPMASRVPTAAVFSAGIVPSPGAYEPTHSMNIDSIAPPYVKAYAQANAIDLGRIGKALFPNGLPSPKGPEGSRAFISSGRYITGNWTYITSRTVLLYELMKVRIGKAPEPRLLVLYNRRTPDEVIIDTFEADWSLSVLDQDYGVISEAGFKTKMKYHAAGMWDMIYADLAIESRQPLARIRYAHTGGGGGRDQEFTFWFRMSDQPVRLSLSKAKQTKDLYYDSPH